MKKVAIRPQRTVARPADVDGVGFITGKSVHLRFRPAPANTGVVFVRTDLGPLACLHATPANVTGTHRRTTLGDGPLSVGLVEHVLSALAAMRIDNCYVDLDAPEPPGLDGSAQGFVAALSEAGSVAQNDQVSIWAVESSVTVHGKNATLTLHPPRAQEFRVTYMLNYGEACAIHPQMFTADITPESYAADIACCRTFLLEEEAREMKKQGYGSRTELSDLLVFGPNGPIDNELRFANEPARHKVLDIMGDFALLGQPLCGHVVAYRSGHPLNVELVTLLSKQMTQRGTTARRAA